MHNEKYTPPHNRKNANWKISTSSIQHPHMNSHSHSPACVRFVLFFMLFACTSSVYFSFARHFFLSIFDVVFFLSIPFVCSSLDFGYFISMLCSHPLLAFYLHNQRKYREKEREETMKSKESNILFPTHSISLNSHVCTQNIQPHERGRRVAGKVFRLSSKKKRARDLLLSYCNFFFSPAFFPPLL